MFKKIGIGAIVITAILFAVIWLTPNIRYNIHTVIPGKVYRSAELSKSELQRLIKKHKIKSIINLRNSHPKERWYQEEIAVAQKNDIELFDLALPAFHKPTREELITLTETLANAKRPILIHCRHGADRSGLASAIVLILRNNQSMDEISKQASWRYRALSPNSVGKVVLPVYAKWLNCHHLKSSAIHFYEWLASPHFLDTNKVCQKDKKLPTKLSFA